MWQHEDFEWKQGIKMFIWCIVFFGMIKLFYVDIYKINGHSMDPSFDDGDKVIAEKISYRSEQPNYGDVVIIKLPKELGGIKLIKRVIGTEGDKIKIEDGQLYRNGKLVKESYINEKIINDFSETTVPKGKFFAMGDNRNHSTDSREYGAFDVEQLEGRVWVYLFHSTETPFKVYKKPS